MAISRRDAIRNMALMMGGTMVGAQAILTGCKPDDQIVGLNFSPKDIALLDEIGEAIIPTTDTPGAKATQIGDFMVMMVLDTYNTAQQEGFVTGINLLRKDFKAKNKQDFMDATLDERTAYLNSLRNGSKTDSDSDEAKMAAFVGMAQDLTVLGYFTSEIGATQQLRYYEAPGRYDGCIDYTPGDRAYAL